MIPEEDNHSINKTRLARNKMLNVQSTENLPDSTQEFVVEKELTPKPKPNPYIKASVARDIRLKASEIKKF